MLHGVPIKSDNLFALIQPAERPLTLSGPFTGTAPDDVIPSLILDSISFLFTLSNEVPIVPIQLSKRCSKKSKQKTVD